MATEDSSNSNALPQMTPDGLTQLARRLREHAGGIKNAAAKSTMGADMTSAAVVIDQLLGLYADIHAVNEIEIVKRILDLVGGPGKARIVLVMPHAEAMALATLAKRIGFEDLTQLADAAVTHDGRPEADVMLAGIGTLHHALAAAGFVAR